MTRQAKAAVETVTEESMSDENGNAVHLDEFCRDLSLDDDRIELISGFHRQMTIEGANQATRREFSTLFDAYQRRPI